MNPKKGEILLTTGLFDPIVSEKEVKFLGEIKERGKPLKWKVELLEPIYRIKELINTPQCFFWLGESNLPEWVREKLEKSNATYLVETESCCDRHATPFCPECGNKIDD